MFALKPIRGSPKGVNISKNRAQRALEVCCTGCMCCAMTCACARVRLYVVVYAEKLLRVRVRSLDHSMDALHFAPFFDVQGSCFARVQLTMS